MRDFVDDLETWLEKAMPDSVLITLPYERQASFIIKKNVALSDLRRGVGLYGEEKADFASTLNFMREARMEALDGKTEGTEDVPQDDEIEELCAVIRVQES